MKSLCTDGLNPGNIDRNLKTNTMNNWIKCSDRLPDDDRCVLVCDGELMEVGFYISPDWYCSEGINEVTHWQELPALPEEGE